MAKRSHEDTCIMDELEHKHKIDDEMGTGGHGSSGGDSDNTSKCGASKHTKVGGEGAVEDMLGHLKCPVCLKIMHKPVALVPCMHNLCAGCLVSCQENAQEKTCQICRATVAGSGRNHALANIIDKFLNTCPQHQREADDIQELDDRVAAKEAETLAGTKGAPAANRGPCTVCGNLVSLDDARIRDADGRYSHEACAVMDEVSSEEEENEDEVSSEEEENEDEVSSEEEETGLSDWSCTVMGHAKDNPECTCNHHLPMAYGVEYEANPECPVKGHSRGVRSVAWSPDGKTLASGSSDKTVRLWDVGDVIKALALEVAHAKGMFTEHIDETNSDGDTPLITAADEGKLEHVQLLLEAGADVFATDKAGRTALYVASQGGFVEIVDCLLQVGGEKLALVHDEDGATALHVASQEGHLEAVECLAKKGGVKLIEIKANDGETAMELASRQGHVKVVECLRAAKLAQDNRVLAQANLKA